MYVHGPWLARPLVPDLDTELNYKVHTRLSWKLNGQKHWSDTLGMRLRVLAPHLHNNVGSTEIRNTLRQAFVKPKHLIGIPDMDITSRSRPICAERPNHLGVF